MLLHLQENLQQDYLTTNPLKQQKVMNHLVNLDLMKKYLLLLHQEQFRVPKQM